MSQTVYQTVTNRIIEQLEKGAMPWVKPWKADSTADKNIGTQKPYQGINRLILGIEGMVSGYDVPVWGTYKQWQAIEMNQNDYKLLYVPEGFALGFQTLEDNTELFYQMSQKYVPESSRGIRYDDPSFNIIWPLEILAISERDKSFEFFRD